MTTEPAPTPARSLRGAPLAVLLLVTGLVVGLILGRVVSSSADPAAGPAPTVTVSAAAEPADDLAPEGGPFGPPESLQDLQALPEYSGRVKDRALAQAGDGSGGGTGSGAGSGSGASGGDASGGVDGDGSGTVDGGNLSDFTMRGVVQGAPILIGDQRELLVRVTNPNSVPITLDRIAVTVRQPSAAGCLPQWLDVDDYDSGDDPAVVVPPGATRTVSLDLVLVNLPTTNQNACQGAQFPLSLSGTART